ncbi:M28 family peptidase [Desulfosediminicola ganghwensis]|uniref:M28 family peptidase n=1 Tax=Desulfosediminicola ganghwensis TaxID=2569540 RepID=UPI0010ABE0EF|nr:M28 family peptidase [Desulfosediminicola ganghwensis]
MRKKMYKAVLFGALITCCATAQTSSAAVGVDSTDLRELIESTQIMATLSDLSIIGERLPGTAGYDSAADYIENTLLSYGYSVTQQPFTFQFWEELADPVLEKTAPTVVSYTPYETDGFATMEYSGSGNVVEQTVIKAEVFGCNPADFDSADFNGSIALIERGECTFFQKAANAEAAGAVAVIVYNDEARQEAFLGTLGGEGITVPVVGAAYSAGLELQEGGTLASIYVDATVTSVETYNIIAETQSGRDDRVVVVGAHLDGVAGTTAMNDNGSGSATILEIAKQMSALGVEPVNKVRFAFWSAEESGLIGSTYYVDHLTERGIKDIALNLNFDMLASPNYVRFVYDGDGSATELAGPNGSANIEAVFADYFDSQQIPFEETAFDGRSDYGPFIEAGIPAGGLFTGADEIKTVEQAAIYDGVAGEMLDANYHTPADNYAQLNEEVLDVMADAAAHTVLTFAMTKSSVNGTAKGSPVAKEKLTYKGPKAQR